MPRSLRAWLASLALIAFPGLAPAQTFLGPPHLAPVALEARCPLVDSLSGAVTHFMALGADPLHVALLKADAEQGAVAVDGAECQDAVAGEGIADAAPADAELRESLARLAAEEPIDVAGSSESRRGSRGGSRFVGSSAVVMLLEEEYLPYDLPADEPLRLRLLPFSTPGCCPLENRPPRALRSAADLASDGAERPEDAADCLELAECYAAVNREKVAPDDEILSSDGSTGCDAAGGQDVIARFAELVPTGRDVAAIRQWVASLQPPMPLHCWMDEAIWQVSDALDAQGPIRRQLDAERMGARIAQWGLRAGRSVAIAAQPVMPILARVPADPKPPAVAPEELPAPAASERAELSLAAGALHSAAGQLENLAAALRFWGTSVDRVARAKPMVPEAIHR